MGCAHLRCYVAEATEGALLILQPLRRVASPTSQALHLRHLANRPCNRGFSRFSSTLRRIPENLRSGVHIAISRRNTKTIVLSQSPEVTRSSHCSSLYTHSDPPSCPWSSAIVLVWHHSRQMGERERVTINCYVRYLKAGLLIGISCDCHGWSYVVSSGSYTAGKSGHLMSLKPLVNMKML